MKVFTYLKGDRVIWAIVFLLSLLSILVVYSSVVTLAHKYKQGNAEAFLFKHTFLIICGIGIICCNFLSNINSFMVYNWSYCNNKNNL